MYFQEQNSSQMLAWIGERKGRVVKHHIPRQLVAFDKRLHLVSLLIILIISPTTFALLLMTPRPFPQIQPLTSRAVDNSSLLECLQVAAPVFSPASECQQTLMTHTFAFSYGQPFVGQLITRRPGGVKVALSTMLTSEPGDYYPPQCNFNRVVFNFTVTSAGRQFDRLALMYFDDIEIFRTSTAEPTQTGIIWNYAKDMSAYLTLFKRPQKVIFDLGNLIDNTYTGAWNTTLIATFFSANDAIEPADIIMPITARKSATNQSSAFIIPESKAINNLTLPMNVRKAVFSISACGQAAEEFWWSNVLTSDTRVFGNEPSLYGHSPFRELQLLIDGQLAGVAWPFPVIFTGGVVPGFWRPIVGIDAFDLHEDEIDISPFLPLLSDNKTHTFEIRVLGIDDDGEGNGQFTENIESNWVVTGKLFVWLDSDTSIATGTSIVVQAPEPSVQLYSVTRGSENGTVDSLDYSVQVSRELHVESIIHTSAGSKTLFWRQNLTFSNVGSLCNKGNDQVIRQTTSGTSSSFPTYDRAFKYPLWIISSYNVISGGNLTINGKMGRGKNVQQIGDLAFPNDWKTFDHDRPPSTLQDLTLLGSNTNNWQNGTASYLSVPAQKRSYGLGSTEQLFSLGGIIGQRTAFFQDSTDGAGTVDQPNEKLYRRHIIAANDSVVYDEESYGGQRIGRHRSFFPSQWTHEEEMHEFAGSGVRVLLGRGPH